VNHLAMRRMVSIGRLPSLSRTSIVASRVAMAMAFLAIALLAAVLSFVPPGLVIVTVVALSVLLLVAMRPVSAAYLLLFLGPLLSGIDRGAAIPFLRPTEAVAALVGVGLLGRGIIIVLASGFPRFRISRMDEAVIVLAIAGSIGPLLWMLARGVEVGSDDIAYGLLLWKFAAIYLIFRTCVKTERQVRICLWIAVLAGAVVSVIAILQALGFAPVVAFIGGYFAPYGNTEAVVNHRGGATLGLPIAAADLLTFDLAIAVGFLLNAKAMFANARNGRLVILVLIGLFAAGVIASGEFSALIGLVIAIMVLAIVSRRGAVLLYLLPGLCIGLYVLKPVIEHRLVGFQSTTGLPVSWTGRLYNLQNYFWPELFSHDRFILGVRLAARVIVPTQATGYVWIESGYTWLLWSGGIPLLIAFVWFACVGIRRGVAVARSRMDTIGVAGLASATGLSVVSVLMVLDPHLTYRGAADLLFALLAMATIHCVRTSTSGSIRSSGRA
jgi:hypothetical protein